MTKRRYEREIAEILERMDRQGRAPAPQRASRPSQYGLRLRALLTTAAGWTGRTWLALSIGLPLLAVLLQHLAPPLATLLALAGVLLFLAPLIVALGGLLRRDERPLWRGRVVEMPNRGGNFAATWRYRVWVWRQRWERWRDGRR